MSKHLVVGEGTYGCVVKPGLQCQENIQVRGRLSKLMSIDSAKKEIKEMQGISGIPEIEKYALEMPTLCTPRKTKAFRDYFDTTKKKYCSGKNLLKSYRRDQVTSLLIEDGGVDLDMLTYETNPKYLNQKTLKIFLTATLQLIDGLKFFRKNDILHRDIKLANIVYNISTGVIKYIDFGMASKLSVLANDNNHSTNSWALSHSYWPKENSCAEKEIFDDHSECKKYKRNMKWKDFNEKAVYSFDIYCLSFAFCDMFKNLVSSNYIDKKTQEEFHQLFQLYCHPDLMKRSIDLHAFSNSYKKLLIKHGFYRVRNMTRKTVKIAITKNKKRKRKKTRSTTR